MTDVFELKHTAATIGNQGVVDVIECLKVACAALDEECSCDMDHACKACEALRVINSRVFGMWKV